MALFERPAVADGAAPFLTATALASVAGVVRQLRRGFSPVTLLLAGIVIAPLVAATFGVPHAIADFLVIVPLVVVLAATGLAAWTTSENVGWRMVGWAAIAALAIDAVRFAAS